MPIKNLLLIWMAKLYISKKSITINLYCHKNNLHFIDVIGHLIKPKEPELLIKKFSKILVKKFYKIYTMDIMLQYSLMVKQVQENHVQFKVFQEFNLKDYCNYVLKMFSEENNKTNLRTLQLLSELLIWKFTIKNSKTYFQKIPKIMRSK